MTNEELRQVIADELGVPISEARDDVKLEALGADSLDLVEIGIELSDVARIPDEKWVECWRDEPTVGSVIALVQEHKGTQRSGRVAKTEDT